ncbi:hypothetical protein IFHNHDMJ_02980 [Synechococcus sp. CBW1107]|nr:hypothetical protein IFHNHDMJ_02980 [Synechococcus sp. CBW1107]
MGPDFVYVLRARLREYLRDVRPDECDDDTLLKEWHTNLVSVVGPDYTNTFGKHLQGLCRGLIQQIESKTDWGRDLIREREQTNTLATIEIQDGEKRIVCYADLRDELLSAVNNLRVYAFVYLKRWSLPGGVIWYKIGITNNPDRRDAEQNVLPVPVENLVTVNVGSMERARAIEAAVIRVLNHFRIREAGNRELFEMSNTQAEAVKSALESLAEPKGDEATAASVPALIESDAGDSEEF